MVEQGREVKQGDGLALAARELRPRLVVSARHFEWVDIHHPVIGQEVADPQGALLLDTVPA